MIGDVWEWTASEFRGYPGFSPYPYREYSEVFFGPDYRVLRGGSFAASADVITPTFRNWDYPRGARSLPACASRRTAMSARTRTAPPQVSVDHAFADPGSRSLAQDALEGLTRPFKELSPKHLYDSRGAALFDEICELEEYYPTRTERLILERDAGKIVAASGAAELVELGSGSAVEDAAAARRDGGRGHAHALRPGRRHRARRSRKRGRS